jgi:hypothetical protein
MSNVTNCPDNSTLTLFTVTDPDFCLAGTKLNSLMKQRGGEQLMPLEKADEIKGKVIIYACRHCYIHSNTATTRSTTADALLCETSVAGATLRIDSGSSI